MVTKYAQPWWDSATSEMSKRVMDMYTGIRNNDDSRLSRYHRYLQMYAGKSVSGLSSVSYYRTSEDPIRAVAEITSQDKVRWNLCKALVDSSTAKVGKNRPSPSIMTTDGDASLKRRSKKLGQFLNGTLAENNIHRDGTIWFRDAAIYGDIFAKNTVQHGRIKSERVFPWELFADHREGYKGKPRTLFQSQIVDKYVALNLVKGIRGAEQAIMEAKPYADDSLVDSIGHNMPYTNLIELVEAWHLPSGPDAKDGVHVVCTSAGLVGTPSRYYRDDFPFSRFAWCPPSTGYWSQGLVEEARPIQQEINKMLMDIYGRLKLGSRPVILEHRAAKVTKPYTDRDFTRVQYSGSIAPSIQVYATSHPEFYQHLERQWNKGFEITGVSQLFASSQKPAGLESGKSILVYNDIGSARFVPIGQRWENFHMQTCEQYITLARDMYEQKNIDLTVKTEAQRRRAKFINSIKWSDVDIDDESYQMQVMPISSLPNEPAGRQSIVQGWIQMGVIEKDYAKSLLDIPDVDSYLNLDLAPFDVILDSLERIIEDGEPMYPTEYDDHELCIKLATASYHRARIDRESEETRNLIRLYIEAAEQALKMKMDAAAQMQQQTGGVGMPQGAMNGGSGANAAAIQ